MTPLAYHPLNLALRLLLELAALAALASYGWQLSEGRLMRLLGAAALPLIAATLWGVFAVPDDPSRSGEAPVAVPGWIRLTLEFAIFGAAIWSLHASRAQTWSLAMGALVLAHYGISYDRVRWLLGLQ